jgi:hypothetical protein
MQIRIERLAMLYQQGLKYTVAEIKTAVGKR